MPPIWKVFYTNHYKYMSYYANRGVEVEHSSSSSDYRSLMYTVNRCVEVKHLRGSIDKGTLMYSQKLSMVREPVTDDWKSQGTPKMTLDSNPRINDLKSMG